MEYKGRAQCLVIRENKILMVKHKQGNDEWYCSPGGGIEKGETPEQAAIRELYEECNVKGTIIKKTSVYVDPCDDNNFFYSFHVDIGNQTPCLGDDPEESKTHSLVEVRWMSLNELSEVDRAFLWASGLLSIPQFINELESWEREISYPNKCADKNDFWQTLDKLVAESKIVIDRPKGSRHSKYPDCIYPLDYGYLEGTTAMDGGGIDIWKGTSGDYIDAIICTVDLLKRDSEIKILIGCTEEEKQLANPDNEYMKGVLIRRNN
jgi:inorganic pyrophosphatase